jgi:cyclopropane-fatty-acyl-phospholipid synthase
MENHLQQAMTTPFPRTDNSGNSPVFAEIQQRFEKLKRRGREPRPFVLRLADGSLRTFGQGEPILRIAVKTAKGVSALSSFDELSFAEAYMAGDIDLDGHPMEFFKFREVLGDPHGLHYLWSFYLKPKLFGQVATDKKHIGSHYDVDPEFFELWLDKSVRAYSHGFYLSDDEPIEAGMERKLQYAIDACGLKPGDRVLDIGGGWGSLLQYGGERGLRVTSITIAEQSARYMRKVVAAKGLPCEVIKEHLLAYKNPEPFDAIINLGVTEHLPDYASTIQQYARLLKPGHKMYLDAYSGPRYGMSAFVTKWVFEGNTSPWCLHEYFEELGKTEFEVLSLQNDRHNYYLSCKKWAENLDNAKDEVVRRWGEFLYRRFRLYLWCAAWAFLDGVLDAHRMVLRLSTDQLGRKLSLGSGRLKRVG